MTRQWGLCLLLFAVSGGVAAAESGRGELLYSTYCDSCHTEKVHWREKKSATNWTSLVAEVRRWQSNAKLEWSRDDVEAVARYLNTLHYHYPLPER
jgi:mono/diheme cytochrome c family protein